METFVAMVYLGAQDTPKFLDAIWHEGHWWLVASWLENPTTGHRIPERIIQMDGRVLRFQDDPTPGWRFLVNNAIPISVFDGTPQDGYIVAIHPAAILNTQGSPSIH